MLETSSPQVFASDVLQLVQAIRRDAVNHDLEHQGLVHQGLAHQELAKSAHQGETTAPNGSLHDAKLPAKLPHVVGLLRSTSDPRLLEAVAYIHKHLEDPIGVQELVSHVGVSRRWLEYAFRDALGETPYQYIRRQRLEHAGRLLADEPNSRIYQVALRTGFNSAKQLTMAFRQHFGLSPRDYRRRLCG